MIPPSELVNEVSRLGGRIWLELGPQEQICVEVPRRAGWLVEEIRKRKPEVVAELKRRYLGCAVLSERVQ